MDKNIININGILVAVIKSEKPVITDTQSALDLIASVSYYDMCDCMAIYKEAISEDFFKLSTGLAGEVLQKFVNYLKKLAVIGDFSIYSSKPLNDFIYECNKGNDIFFVSSEKEAVEKLSAAGFKTEE